MFEISTFNVDKLIHTLVQSLGLKIKSPAYNNFNKITFLRCIDRTYKIKEVIPCSAEQINEINVQQNWDFCNEKDILRFIEKHTTCLDKFISSSNTGILTFPLKNINTKILQKVKKRKKDNESTKTVGIKIKKKRNSLSPISRRDKSHNFVKHKRSKLEKPATCENSKIFYNDKNTLNDRKNIRILKTRNDSRKDFLNYNLSNSMINVMEKEIKIAKRFLQLYATNEEYIRRNVQVTLHVSKKSNYGNIRTRLQYIQMLSRHAILCLIEPSKNATVLFEDDLSCVVQKYLLHGFKYNFEFQRDSKDCYFALLVLSRRAKVLVNRVNSTAMQTICGVLGCDVQNILVLYNPNEEVL